MIHSKSKGTKLIIGLLAAILTLCICCVMLISNGKSNVGVAYAESTAVETTDTTTTTETEQTEIDYSTMFNYSVSSKNTVTINGYIGTDTDVVIPSEIDGKPVTSIDSSAFYNCSSLTSVIIPESVTKISGYAFYYCTSLISVTIPENITYISERAFAYCSSLTEINLHENITSIYDDAFFYCTSLTNIKLPKNLKSIGAHAFYHSGITSINIPLSITHINRGAFEECRNLKSVYITSIEQWCGFSFVNSYTNPLMYGGELYLNNELVTNLDIPNTITQIGNYAFYGCSSLVKVTIPESVTTIGEEAFRRCTNLTTINLPKNITKISYCLFYDCSSLISVNIPENVTSIATTAFRNCTSLTSITIPDNVISIRASAFEGCTNLQSIKFSDNSSLTSIDDSAFYRCFSLKNIHIPKGVTNIGNDAFDTCTKLMVVYVNNAELANDFTASNLQGWLFSSRQAIAVIGENPTVSSLITNKYANTEVITYNGNTYTVYSTHEQAWELDYKIEPDCVNDGFEQYVCTTCGLVKNNVIPATGHTESDWIVDINATTDCAGHKYVECTVCKEVLLEEEIPALGVVVDEEINYQHSCSFHNNLTLNFYIPAEDLNKYDSFYLFVEQDIYANGIWGVQSFEIRKSELTSNGYKFVFTGIGAADAGNEIRATLYAKLGDVQYKSLVDVYSVKTYAYNRLAKSTDAQFKTLLVDMLNYCSAAQVYFGVNVDNLVNADLTEEQKALATAADSTVADTSSTVALEGATAQIKAKSIVFNSNIEVKFYMDLSAYQDLTGIALRITYTDGLGVTHVTVVESTEFVYEKSQESYTAKLVDLNSAELRAQIQVEIMLEEQVISDTLYYSVETYVYNRLSKSTDENFKALLKVLMKYSDSANKYFYKGGN